MQGDPTRAAIISFGTSGNNAMVLSGDSTGNANGIAYAPRGGITLSDGSNWHGALVAGGAPGSAKVTLSGGSGVQMTVGLISGSPLFNGGGDDGGSGAGTLSIVRMREL